MIGLSSNHLLSRIFYLYGTAKQVENEREIDVLGVHKTSELRNLSGFEVSIKLIALEPRIVELIADCACYLKEGICPGVSPNHCEIEIIKTVEGVTGFFPTLRGKCIVRKLKAGVERVHVNVNS